MLFRQRYYVNALGLTDSDGITFQTTMSPFPSGCEIETILIIF